MDLPSLLALSCGLAMDAFAVSIAMGVALPKVRPTQMLRLALAFGGFQALMPVVGYLAGCSIAQYEWVASYDHWIAFFLLAGMGSKMIYEARFLDGEAEEVSVEKDPTKSLTLLMLALATSIDALAVGVSLALLRIRILQPAVVIGLTAAAFAIAGVRLGGRFGKHLGPRVEMLGGLALIAIGARILYEHLTHPAF